MKLLLAFINPHKLEILKERLDRQDFHGLTISDAMGYGRQKGKTEIYRGETFTPYLIKKMRVEIICSNDDSGEIAQILMDVCQTKPDGQIGDGKIVIMPIDDVIRVSSGERGHEAI